MKLRKRNSGSGQNLRVTRSSSKVMKKVLSSSNKKKLRIRIKPSKPDPKPSKDFCPLLDTVSSIKSTAPVQGKQPPVVKDCDVCGKRGTVRLESCGWKTPRKHKFRLRCHSCKTRYPSNYLNLGQSPIPASPKEPEEEVSQIPPPKPKSPIPSQAAVGTSTEDLPLPVECHCHLCDMPVESKFAVDHVTELHFDPGAFYCIHCGFRLSLVDEEVMRAHVISEHPQYDSSGFVDCTMKYASEFDFVIKLAFPETHKKLMETYGTTCPDIF